MTGYQYKLILHTDGNFKQITLNHLYIKNNI